MKNNLILSFSALIIFLALACSDGNAQVNQTMGESPNIKIAVAGAAAGDVLLVANIGDQQFVQDTAQSDANGQALFNRQQPYAKGLYLAYYTDKTIVQFLIDEDQTFELVAQKSELPNKVAVSGSLANELFYDNRAFEASLQDRVSSANQTLQTATKGTAEYEEAKVALEALLEERKQHLDAVFAKHPDNFYVSFKQAGQNPDLRKDLVLPDGSPDNEAQVEAYRKDFWENVNFNDTALLRTPVIFNKLNRYMEELTPRNAAAKIESADYLIQKVIDKPQFFQYVANWITLKYEPGKTPLMDGEAVYVHMIKNYFTKERAFWSDSMTVYGLQQRADEMAQSLIGQPGPNITVPDINGVPKTLYDLKAPYLIVFLYNPTCEHCIEQTPKVLDFIKSRPAGEVELYAIGIDTEMEPWKDFVNRYGMQAYTNVYDPTNRSIYKTYYVDHTPELYLLGPDRKIIGKNLKANQVGQVIDRDKASRK